MVESTIGEERKSMPQTRKRHAIVGLGARSGMYARAILVTHADRHELVGLCDTNRTRMAWCNANYRKWGAVANVPAYSPDAFDRMLATERPDTVIGTSIDSTHHRYIVRAMELGCDEISEKPMTIDA